MTSVSVVLGFLGLLASAAMVQHIRRWVPNPGPKHCWFLGLAALFPAWLLAFLALIPSPVLSGQGSRAALPPRVILCSGAALLGVIFTDMAARWLDKSGHSLSPFTYWLLGTTGLLPAWLFALWILR